MKFLLFVFILVLSTSCGLKPALVDFTNACTGAPDRKLAVEGFVDHENPACSPSPGARECSFWLKEINGPSQILFTVKEGEAAGQIELSKPETDSKLVARVRDGNGNFVDLKKPVILSGKTTRLLSSSMSPVCRLDEAQISQ